MKLLIHLIDWEYPDTREAFRPSLWTLADPSDLEKLVLALANGLVIELRAVAQSAEALDTLRRLLIGTGQFKPVVLTAEEQARLWLWSPGDETYRQGSTSPAFAFLDPTPRPEKF